MTIESVAVLRFKARLARTQVTVPEDAIERATWNIESGVVDFMIAMRAAKTTNEAMRLFDRLERLHTLMETAISASLERADELCGIK